MTYVFVDEAGDTGTKYWQNSSRYFVVSAVVFDDPIQAANCAQAIARLRRTLQKIFADQLLIASPLVITIDKISNQDFARKLRKTIAQAVSPAKISKFRQHDSRKTELLQLADYIAGIVYGCVRQKHSALGYYQKLKSKGKIAKV